MCLSEMAPSAAVLAQMNFTPLLDFFGNAIYGALALAAGFGLYCIVVLWRRVQQKSFPSRDAANTFIDDVGERLDNNDFEGVKSLCDVPEVWAKAVPQLVYVAVENRNRPVKKIKQIIGEYFEREIISDLDARMSWVNTMVKSAPMLGLLGTVTGMITAFKKIAGTGESGVKPSELAADISFALFTTAAGLAIAIPLVVLGAMVQVRIAKLQDSVQEQVGTFVDDLEAAQVRSRG